MKKDKRFSYWYNPDCFHKFRVGKITYLVYKDEESVSATIIKCRIGRCKKFRLPTSVCYEGKRYEVNSFEFHSIPNSPLLEYLGIPKSYRQVYVDLMYRWSELKPKTIHRI